MWEIEVEHQGLGKYRKIRGRDKYSVEMKAQEQKIIWDNQWNSILLKEEKRQNQEKNSNHADVLTNLAKNDIANLENFLTNVIQKEYKLLNADELIDRSKFLQNKPTNETKKPPTKPNISNTTFKNEDIPEKDNVKYNIIFILLCFILPFFFLDYFADIKDIDIKIRSILITVAIIYIIMSFFILNKIKKESAEKWEEKVLAIKQYNKQQLDAQYEKNLKMWQEECDSISEMNKKNDNIYKKELKEWEKDKEEFIKKQNSNNSSIINKIEKYKEDCGDGNFLKYLLLAFSKLTLPSNFSPNHQLIYDDEANIVIIDFYVPSLDDLPRTKEFKYIKISDEIRETMHSESFMKKLYDSLIYQILLAIPYVVYNADYKKYAESVVINIRLDTIDKSFGQKVDICIASLQMSRAEFEEIDFSLVDAKQCFRKLKGVACAQIESKTAIQPILSFSKEDKRFVESHEVMKNIDQGTNLAAINWQDFENLIREIFEKEFSQNGGECKVTQASRDGGVDAIAFDPDPIRGGKIVIQAKRYTNVVGVSAVRDLYGTVMNEGAIKGILITTSNYGSDAYNFAKNKPITLLDGSNLLHLLEKHGQKAYINLKEAKKLLSPIDG